MKPVAAIVASVLVAVGSVVAACANGPDPGDDAQGDTATSDAAAAPPADAGSHDAGTPAEGAASDTAAPDARLACLPTDAGCTTPNAGACAAGVIDCDDAGAPFCRPLATTQACYSGATGTRGKGQCKDGVQTCVGALGACTGEVLPAAHEDCFNALDDDCDGVSNNGCPDHVALGTASPLTAHGGTSNARSVFCPPNAFVTRSTFYFDQANKHASGVAIYCAAPALVQGASTYSIALTQVAPAPYAISTGNNPSSPYGDYDCGITGLVGASWLVGTADSFIEGLGMHCSSGLLSLSADNKLTFDFSETGSASYTYYPGGSPFQDDCPPHQLLVGYNLQAGDWLDGIQSVCAPLLTFYK